ncbi:SAC3/GANP/Nin1/mts3/eIF-3 p25 family-domain-containing protein [Lipomyces arxii]|uniref:SAC3/GANP/Nin1/mts3/eIF-3 p25 family-domain-containing protein n=1 Tax=Lipomyces arxii TaxID=56418 RepID=UPI0034CD14C7
MFNLNGPRYGNDRPYVSHHVPNSNDPSVFANASGQRKQAGNSSNLSAVNYFQRGSHATDSGVSVGFRKTGFQKNKSHGGLKTINANSKVEDSWDERNQAAMSELERTWTGDLQSLYEKLQKIRDRERMEMEKRGLVDKQDAQKSLTDAIIFTGTCSDMCPVYERVRRSYENNVAPFEKDASGKMDPHQAVKAFSRPAAGQPPPLPSDVRPPGVLQETLTYLVNTIVPKLPDSHTFLWDRTRSIRQDFTYQNYSGYEAVDCNERIARAHIVSLHVLAGSDVEYSRQQELEQFNKALQTLHEFYTDARQKGAQLPNEAEFQAYRLLSHIRDADLERQIQGLPLSVFLDSRVQLALVLRSLVQQNDISERGYTNLENAQNMFFRFFKLLKSSSVSFLFACLLEVHFTDIRMWALRSMASGYHKRGKPYKAADLVSLLGCDNEAEVISLCDHFELTKTFGDDEITIDVTSWNDSTALGKPPQRQAYSISIVESKREGKPLQYFVSGNNLEIYPQNSKNINVSVRDLFPLKPSIADFSTSSLSIPRQSGPFLPSARDFQLHTSPLRNSYNTSSVNLVGVERNLANVHENGDVIFTPQSAQNSSVSNRQIESVSMVPAMFSTTPANTFFNNGRSSISASEPTLVLVPALATPAHLAAPNLQELGSSTDNENFEREKDSAKLKTEKKNTLITASVAERDDLVSEVVTNNVRQICENAREALQKVQDGYKKMIELLSEEMFASLLYDNTWQACQESEASEYYRRSLLRRALKRIRLVAFISKSNAELRRKRQNQYLEAFSMMGRPLKRQKALTRNAAQFESFDETKRISFMESDRTMMQRLWTPINLYDLFLKSVEETFETYGLFDGVLDVDTFTSDWHAPAGVWLRKKLGMKWNGTTFSRVLEGKSITLTFSTMTNDLESYENVGALIFQCGRTDNNSSKTVEQKLEFDREALYEAIKRLQRHSCFGLALMIIYWPFEGISTKELAKRLNLANFYGNGARTLTSLLLLSIATVSDTDISMGMEMLAKSIKL